MGTPQFAVPVLLSLFKVSDVVGVFSQPPALTGRGKQLARSAIHQCADSLKIDVFMPENFKDSNQIEILKRFNPDIIVVAAYGLILPKEVLSIPKLGCINVHASLLPKWRGASPIQQSIITGDKITGVTLMKMSVGLDAGDIAMQESVSVPPIITAGMLSEILSHLGAAMMEKFMQSPKKYLEKTYPQDPSLATYAKKLTKLDGKICWNDRAENIFNKIRGLNPWPCAWVYIGDKYVKLLESEVIEASSNSNILPGTIIDKDFSVKCKDSIIQIKTLCPSGGKAMSGKAFLNGHKYLALSVI
jgi:methionyl-tRNA formyltransferase